MSERPSFDSVDLTDLQTVWRETFVACVRRGESVDAAALNAHAAMREYGRVVARLREEMVDGVGAETDRRKDPNQGS